jgi:hypothetical protein
MNLKVEEWVKQIIGSEEEYIIGFAHLAGLVPEMYGNHHYGIVIGKKLDPKIKRFLCRPGKGEGQDNFFSRSHRRSCKK